MDLRLLKPPEQLVKVKLVLQLNTVELVLRMKLLSTQGGSNQWLGETESLLDSQRGMNFQKHISARGGGGVQGEGAMDYKRCMLI